MPTILPTGGRWALSRIVFDPVLGLWTTSAHRDRPPSSGSVQNYLPPLEMYTAGGRFGLAWASTAAAVTAGPDTILLPELALEDTLGTSAGRLRSDLEDRCKGYQWTEPEQPRRTVPDLDLSAWGSATRFGEALLADVLRAYCRHDLFRPRAPRSSFHNTEYTDDFSSNPNPRWTNKLGATWSWDSTNDELSADAGTAYLWNYDTDPGSIEHECQVTWELHKDYHGGAGIRMDEGASTDDGYEIDYIPSADDVIVVRVNGGTRTGVQTQDCGVAIALNDFISSRNAAEGTAGNNVLIDGWLTNHGTTKPSDPGWIGSDESPNWETTDSHADRLDASTHIQCGMSSFNTPSDDEHYDNWKARAISDRGGVAAALPFSRSRAMGALFAS